MKKLLLLPIFLLFAFLGISQTNSRVNSLENFSFENWSGNPESPDSWNIVNPNSVVKSTEATEGNYALELDLSNSLSSPTEISTRNTSEVILKTATTHTYTFDYKVVSGDEGVSANLYIYRDYGSYTIQFRNQFVPINGDGNWHTFSFDFETDPEDEKYVFELSFRANTTPTRVVRIDNMRLLSDIPPDADNDGVPDANDLCPNTPSAAVAVDDDGCEITIDNKNVLEDPSFEDWSYGGGANLAKWGIYIQLGSWEKNSDVSDDLDYSAQLTTGSGSSNTIFQNDIMLYKGVEYTIAVDYKVLEGSFNTLELELFNQQGTFGESVAKYTVNPEASGWHTYSTTFTPLANEMVDLNIRVKSDQPQGSILLDNTVIKANIGSTDDDNDSVENTLDLCPNTPSGETVDVNGCSQSQLDDDNDGVKNSKDNCPNTPSGETVDANGCSQSQLDGDDDNDGVKNSKDICPNTPSGESVDANGCSQSQLDDDKDGVTNDLDTCPSTPGGNQVDNKGCTLSQENSPELSNNDITVSVTSTTCPNTANGEINITFKKDYNYNISVTGIKTETYQNVKSADGLIISDLPEGNYDICVTIPEYDSFISCFTAVIGTPQDFTSGKTVVDYNKKTAKLVVSGSKKYTVNVNDKTFNYSFNDTGIQEVTFNLEEGTNTIITQTDKLCQGEHQETVVLNKVMVSPNPTTLNTANILGLVNTENASISISNASGAVLNTFSMSIENGSLKVPISDLPVGVYYIKITSNEQAAFTKIIKK